jgi:H+/Cl- antiporter ClcA
MNATGAVKFGALTTVDNSLFDLFAAILIGVVCGLLGSFFIYVQTKMAKLRKMFITTNSKKIFEAIFFAFVTAAGFYLAVLLTQEDCLTATPLD